MTTKNPYWCTLRLLFLITIALAVKKAWAATPEIPVVHILATDPCADETGQETATFTVIRSGPTNAPLTVHYRLAGSATNGVDYLPLSGSVTIPANASSAPITITPIDDGWVEGPETVAVFLHQFPVWPPPYVVCWPSFALGHVEDNDFAPTNHPPVVRVVNPPDGSIFVGPVDLRLVAQATDFDGRVVSVEFFDGNLSLGIVSNRSPIVRPVPLLDDRLELAVEMDPASYPELEIDPAIDPIVLPPASFSLVWSNVPPGGHAITAVATDNRGASSRSEPVEIQVIEPPHQTVVNVRAADPVATEPGDTADRLDTATFTIGRTGPTDLPLTVYYRLSGMASNGVDYRELPHRVTIPRGATRVEVVVDPLADNLVEGPEKVVLTLVAPLCIQIFPPPPDCYHVGRYDTARAVINDSDVAPGNLPPVVEMVRPLDGSVFLAPADIALIAAARDFDGRVVTVEFFEGTNSLGVVSNTPSLLDATRPPFALKWAGVPPGHYLLSAEATDNDGAKSHSRPVEIKVVERTIPPVVSIEATDPEAAEVLPPGTPNPATFTVRRTGPTTRGLLVRYSLGGTAANGIDYQLLSRQVLIPAGSSTAPIVVEPIDDRLVEGVETVSVTIEPPICIAIFPAPPDCYVVGTNNSARAAIRDNDVSPSNLPPRVALVRPEEGSIFTAPADIFLLAEAKDADGFVRTVEFFEGTNSLGIVSNSLSVIGTSASILPWPEQFFRLAWDKVPAGGYILTALATDNRGASSRSDPIRIKVIDEHRQPVVAIEATDPFASEGDWILQPIPLTDGAVSFIGPPIIDRPNIATFTVRRDRGTNIPLTVYYSLSGTASNGVDYRRLNGSVTIPQGAWRAHIIVDAIEDKLIEGTETVVASLDPIACARALLPSPECYIVGEPARAVAYIRDNDFENQLPKVEIASPANESLFLAPADIEIVALVRDPDGYVTEVEFFAGTNSIGKDGRVYIIAPPPGELHKFSIIWSNVPPGRYELTAKATDDRGGSSRSDVVVVKVVSRCPVPVVTLRATDRLATEQSPLLDRIPDLGVFTVMRTCATNAELKVRYAIGGSAENGRDYQKLEGTVAIPAGALSAEIIVDPIDDERAEGTETIELKLLESDCASVDMVRDGCYLVGTPASDIVYLRDDESFPPKVAIVKPQDGDKFREGAEISIVVQAADADGWVSRVDFYAGNRLIGSQEILFVVPPPPGQLQRFSMVWSNAPVGRHVLTARATDDQGIVGLSGPVGIEVLDGSLPPVVNIFSLDPFAREGVTPPNTATFRLRRSGETNASLTVHFAILGAAVNGMDYLTIPSSVTIPAGRRTARIVVTPIDDRIPERIETVILRLHPTALYNVGRWGRAGAIILDNDEPSPGSLCLDDRSFHLRLDGKNGQPYRLELSADFTKWEPLEANYVTDDAIHFVDPEASEMGERFYRVSPVTDVELFDEE